jgi:chemotaxis response regulator CheB
VVQDPATAESPVMPHAAQRAVPEATIVPLPAIAETLMRMVRPRVLRGQEQ